MNRLRQPLWIAAIAAALLLLVAGLAFVPSVQTWAVRRVLASHPGLGVSVGRVSANLARVHLDDLRIERPGVRAEFPRVDATISPWRALIGRLSIERLESKEWRVDVLNAKGAAHAEAVGADPSRSWPSLIASAWAAEAPAKGGEGAVATGIVSKIRLPFAVSVARVDLAGVVTVPLPAGASRADVKVGVRGGGLAPGRDARFDFTAATDLPSGTLAGRIETVGTLSGRLETPRAFSQVSLLVSARASGGRMKTPARLALEAFLIRVPEGESYRVDLRSGGEMLVDIHSQMPASSGTLHGAWKMNVSDAELTPFALGRALPRFSLQGHGDFEASLDGLTFEMAGDLAGKADRLERLEPSLGAMGAVGFSGVFDLDRKGNDLRVTKLRAEVERNGSPVVEAEALQGFEFDAAHLQLKVEEPGKGLARVNFSNLPLAWLAPYFRGGEIYGEGLNGELMVSAREGGFAMTSPHPIEVRRMGLSAGGKAVLQNVGLLADVSGEYTPAGWQTDFTRLELSDSSGALLSMRLRAGSLADTAGTVKLQGQWTLSLPACFDQPGLSRLARLGSGVLQGDIQGSLGATKDLLMRLSLQGVTTKEPRVETLPDFAAELRASVDAAGKLAVRMPVTITNVKAGHKSSLVVDLTSPSAKLDSTMDVKVAGGEVYAEDLKSLFAPFVQVVKRGGATPTAGLPWGGLRGTCSLAVARVVMNPTVSAEQVAAELRFGPDGADLTAAKALVNRSCSVSGDGKLSFDPSRAQHYTVQTDFSVTGFDGAWVLGAASHDDAPAIEGTFDCKGSLAGDGASIEAAARTVHGRLDLLSRGGRFRLLKTDISNLLVSRDSLGDAVISGIGALIGRGGKGSGKLDDNARMAKDLAAALADLQFDQMSVEADLDASGAIRMKDFTLITPDVRLGGEGEIAPDAERPIMDRPLRLKVQIALRGAPAEIARRAKLSDGRTDELGYTIIPHSFKLGGTLAHCDTGGLKLLFEQMVVAKGGSLLDRLRGR